MPSAGTLTSGRRPQSCPVWMLGVACVTVPPLSDVSPSFMTERNQDGDGGPAGLRHCGVFMGNACQWTLPAALPAKAPGGPSSPGHPHLGVQPQGLASWNAILANAPVSPFSSMALQLGRTQGSNCLSPGAEGRALRTHMGSLPALLCTASGQTGAEPR